MLKIVRSKNERVNRQDNRCGSGIIGFGPFNTGRITKVVQLPRHIRLSNGTKTMGTIGRTIIDVHKTIRTIEGTIIEVHEFKIASKIAIEPFFITILRKNIALT